MPGKGIFIEKRMDGDGYRKEDSMIGWRARLGVVVLATNLTVEYEFRQMVPEGVSFNVARCQMPDTAQCEQEKEELFRGIGNNVLHAAEQLSMAKPDVILFACTVGSFLGGRGHDEEISAMISQKTGIPSLTTASAVLKAIRALGIEKITLLSPYTEGTGVKEKYFLEESIPGLKVLSMKHLGVIGSFEKNLLPPSSAYRAAREAVVSDADGLFISCTAWRSMEIIASLERDLQIPVVTSTQASLWACLERCQVKGSDKFGKLFSLS
jgi:maleate isomerase